MTSPEPSRRIVPVIPADRVAAWPRRPSCYSHEDMRMWYAGHYDGIEAIQSYARYRVSLTSAFQKDVDAWMTECFGPAIKTDMVERADRFVEEALELAQTVPGFNAERAHALVDYVFSRPTGEPGQEIGGVMVTLAALCNAGGLDMAGAGAAELARVWTKINAIREKQAAKPSGSALPIG